MPRTKMESSLKSNEELRRIREQDIPMTTIRLPASQMQLEELLAAAKEKNEVSLDFVARRAVVALLLAAVDAPVPLPMDRSQWYRQPPVFSKSKYQFRSDGIVHHPLQKVVHNHLDERFKVIPLNDGISYTRYAPGALNRDVGKSKVKINNAVNLPTAIYGEVLKCAALHQMNPEDFLQQAIQKFVGERVKAKSTKVSMAVQERYMSQLDREERLEKRKAELALLRNLEVLGDE